MSVGTNRMWCDLDTVHDAFVEHPLVAAYVSIRVWGRVLAHRDVVAAEIRSRCPVGGRVLAIAPRRLDRELDVAARVPDRSFDLIARRDEDAERARDIVVRTGMDHVRVRTGGLDGVERTAYHGLLCLYAGAHFDAAELWAAARAALRPRASVLAQDYLGPANFAWPLEQAADLALERVPDHLRSHHSRAADLRHALVENDPRLARASGELVSSCAAAGFTIAARVGAGCGLLQPVLAGQIGLYDPSDWNHNLVLSDLFRQEDALARQGHDVDAFGMFIAEAP